MADREPSRSRTDSSAACGSSPQPSIAGLCINTIRMLSIDAVEEANSGHPGTPMALAPVVYTLWQNFLRFDPEDPIWPNRDRLAERLIEAAQQQLEQVREEAR